MFEHPDELRHEVRFQRLSFETMIHDSPTPNSKKKEILATSKFLEKLRARRLRGPDRTVLKGLVGVEAPGEEFFKLDAAVYVRLLLRGDHLTASLSEQRHLGQRVQELAQEECLNLVKLQIRKDEKIPLF